jgi:opacity protein-like surface antigen
MVNRLLFYCSCVILLLTCTLASAQNRRSGARNSRASQQDFLNKQFWVGFKGGINFTKAKPIDRYSAFSSISDPSGNSFDKQYKNYSNMAAQFALVVNFHYKNFALSFQPGIRRMTYQYSNTYSWSDPITPSNFLQQEYKAISKLDYLDFPLLLKYEPLRHTKIIPFVQIGLYYSRLNNAFKETTLNVTDGASGGGSSYEAEKIAVGAKDLYLRSHFGWTAGAGVSYPLGNARLALEFNYTHNTHNITNTANRYDNDRLTGSGDIPDNIKLRNIGISCSILMPLRFIILKENYKTE